MYFSNALFEGLAYTFGGAYIWKGLYTVGNLCYKINWAILLVGMEVKKKSYYIHEGDLMESILGYGVEGVIFGTW